MDDNRKGDPSRPELTTARVRELLQAVPRIHERDAAIGQFVFRPESPDDAGRSAAQLLGKDLAAVVEEVSGDAHAFARDLFWLHAIAFRLRDGATLDEHLQRAEAFSSAEDWKPLIEQKRGALAGAAGSVVSLIHRVSHSEEAAVLPLAEEAIAMFFRYRQIR